MLLPISKLESIVFSKALLSSIELNIRNELNVDKVLDIIAYNPIIYPNHLVVSGVLLFIYGQMMYFQGHNTAYCKYMKIPKYNTFRVSLRFAITIIMVLFIKDIQSVH